MERAAHAWGSVPLPPQWLKQSLLPLFNELPLSFLSSGRLGFHLLSLLSLSHRAGSKPAGSVILLFSFKTKKKNKSKTKKNKKNLTKQTQLCCSS